MAISECARCGRVFTSVSGFDAHQEKHYGTDTPVICLDPADVGLTIDNQTGRWHFPETAASRARLTKMRASGAPARVTGRDQE